MKSSVPRQIIVAIFMLTPLLMVGMKASPPADRVSMENVIRLSPDLNNSSSHSTADHLFSVSHLSEFGLSEDVFDLAIKGFSNLENKGLTNHDSILTIVDFSKSSREKRMLVVDLKKHEVLFHTVVAHGRGTGAEFAKSFSNQPRSHKSSLGFYLTKSTYQGSNGYSLKLDGVERGFNDQAMSRAIVMHAADYANEDVIGNRGYLGRSFGCPAVPEKINKKIIDKIKNGNVLFVYYPDSKYLAQSKLLNG